MSALGNIFLLQFFCLQKEEEKWKERDRTKSRNIDHFMEELKMEQEMRERRSSDRDRGRESWQKGNSSVCFYILNSFWFFFL